MIVAQSSVTARAYAAKHHQTLDENRDLLGISAANAAAALSGTFVVNGSPTQTAMVETSGGTNQLAHLSTALVVMLVLLFLTGPLQYLPVCVLGAIVFTIAVRLVDLRGLSDLHREEPRRVASGARNRCFRSSFRRGGRHPARAGAVAASACTPQLQAFGSGENADSRRQLADERCGTRPDGGARAVGVLVRVRSLLCQC